MRDDLESLRIDRGAHAERRRPRWLGPVLGAGLLVAFVIASALAYRLTLGGSPAVQVAYAERSLDGESLRGEVLTGSGYIVTRDRYVSLGVRVPGRIESYLVDEGDRVTRGQALVQIDARRFEAALREAQASLRLAGANDCNLWRRDASRQVDLLGDAA